MDTATKRRPHGAPAAKATKADRLAADFQAFVGDVEQVLKSASHLPGDSLSAARLRLEEKVAQARVQLADGIGEARDAGEAYLRERPWTFVGVALLVGAVAGMLLARRG
jgi:ElaB/YqjD/DUF883 family membrane-anchored ribosome-binding protein